MNRESFCPASLTDGSKDDILQRELILKIQIMTLVVRGLMEILLIILD